MAAGTLGVTHTPKNSTHEAGPCTAGTPGPGDLSKREPLPQSHLRERLIGLLHCPSRDGTSWAWGCSFVQGGEKENSREQWLLCPQITMATGTLHREGCVCVCAPEALKVNAMV